MVTKFAICQSRKKNKNNSNTNDQKILLQTKTTQVVSTITPSTTTVLSKYITMKTQILWIGGIMYSDKINAGDGTL